MNFKELLIDLCDQKNYTRRTVEEHRTISEVLPQARSEMKEGWPLPVLG